MVTMKSTIDKIFDEAISHYDFVIEDLSSDIYNPVLQREKGPVIDFLKRMRQEWLVSQALMRAQSSRPLTDKKEEP